MRSSSSGLWARWLNAVLGVWLFFSAFAWPHTAGQRSNAWILGVLAVLFAVLAAVRLPMARYANTAAAVWLFVSTFMLPKLSPGTVANDVAIAILMFACSLVPSAPRREGFA
jgi:hypothetical protein